MCSYYFFFFKQRTAYEMRISDWSSDVCSSDLRIGVGDVIDRVVDKLERDAEVAAISVERGLGGFLALGDDRGDPARGGEQRGGLGADDVEIAFLAEVDPARRGKLVDFAFRDHRRGVGEDLERLQAAVFDHQFRSEEHTSELQSLMRISYAVFCLKKKKQNYKRSS